MQAIAEQDVGGAAAIHEHTLEPDAIDARIQN